MGGATETGGAAGERGGGFGGPAVVCERAELRVEGRARRAYLVSGRRRDRRARAIAYQVVALRGQPAADIGAGRGRVPGDDRVPGVDRAVAVADAAAGGAGRVAGNRVARESQHTRRVIVNGAAAAGGDGVAADCAGKN